MEIGTLRFWFGSLRYRVLSRCVLAGKILPVKSFARISDLAAIRSDLDVVRGWGIQPLPVIDLDSDEEADLSDEAVNVWHVGPVPVSGASDWANYNHLRDIGEFQGDFAAYKRWLRRY